MVALSSVGLPTSTVATTSTTSATSTPPELTSAETGAPQVKKKKKGMTQKVKNFLSGLPDLKHLYSKSVVE
ncbi:unnamed protein product [Symbiodinium natans]|uniref:Uncharacterized protein n=1 Tax=Symbiodinium natans TaxID=878477 RepID=A0A812NPP5_9DINO|nr:unnamed protein product [Symbiodinium natans]